MSSRLPLRRLPQTDLVPSDLRDSLPQSNLGSLYTVLQMFVLGAHLYSKKTSHRPPFGALAYLFLYRFFLMPVISVGTIYLMRKHLGEWVKADPVLVSAFCYKWIGRKASDLAQG